MMHPRTQQNTRLLHYLHNRNKKRLASLQHVRPAFMDEYEKLEGDLQKQYVVYLERFRNLDYLEHELGELDKAEREKVEEAERSLKRMQKRLREEELKILRGEQGAAGGGRHGNGHRGDNAEGGSRSMFSSRQTGKNGDIASSRMTGKMKGGDSDSSSDEISDEDLTNESGDDSDSEEDVSIEGSSGSDDESSNLIENDSESSEDEAGQGEYDFGSGDSDDAF